MIRHGWFIVSVLTLLVVSHGFWLFLVLDISIDHAYLKDHVDALNARNRILGNLVSEYSEDVDMEIIYNYLYETDQPYPNVYRLEDDTLLVHGMMLRFDGDRIVGVDFR